MSAASLRETQAWFFRQLAAGAPGRGVAARISGGRLTPAQRLRIYSSMYFARLLESLQEDFPKTREVLGDEAFEALARAYLAKHPSRHPSLRHLGDRLPSFLGHGRWARTPWLAELARLERALVDAFDAPDATPLGAQSLASLPAGAWGGLRFGFHPSLRRLRFAHAVDRLWERLDEGRDAAPPGKQPSRLRVWRQGFTVMRAPLDAREDAVLAGLAAGRDFAWACARQGTAEAAARALATWLSEGLIVSIVQR